MVLDGGGDYERRLQAARILRSYDLLDDATTRWLDDNEARYYYDEG